MTDSDARYAADRVRRAIDTTTPEELMEIYGCKERESAEWLHRRDLWTLARLCLTPAAVRTLALEYLERAGL